jgi:hypothetical protein
MNMLFEQHLRATSFLTIPLNEETEQVNEDEVLTDILTEFAQFIAKDDDEDYDLEAVFEDWCEYQEFSIETVDLLKGILIEAVQQLGGQGIDEDINPFYKSLPNHILSHLEPLLTRRE